jgi:hypothetical protein
MALDCLLLKVSLRGLAVQLVSKKIRIEGVVSSLPCQPALYILIKNNFIFTPVCLTGHAEVNLLNLRTIVLPNSEQCQIDYWNLPLTVPGYNF